MPNCVIHSDKMSKRGNPTRSIAMNNFIKLFKKLEVKKLGVQLKARRAIAEVEFKQIKDLCFKMSEESLVSNDSRYSTIAKFGIAVQMNFQFHMLTRLDDTYNVPRENIQVHPNFNFVLKTS